MRRPSLATVASYGTVIAMNAMEGTLGLLIPPYLEHAGYPIALIGILAALPSGVALLTRVPAGLLYRGSRARALIAGAGAAAAIAVLLYPLAPDALAFGALRALQGVAYAVATTVALAHFMGSHGTGAAAGRAMGYYASGLAAGYMLGGAVGGVLAERWGYGVAFAGAALVALAAGALGQGLPPAAPTPPPPSAGPALGRLASIRRALGDPGLAYATLVMFLSTLIYHVPGTFFPLYALAVGLGLGEVGFTRAAFAFVNAAVRGVSGVVLERVGGRQAVALGLVCHAVALALVPAFNTFLPLLALLLFVAFWRAVVLVASAIALAEEVNPARVSRGVASGVYNAANDLSGLVAPAAGGLIAAAFGLDNLFRLLPAVAVAAYFGLASWIDHAARSEAQAGATKS